MKINFRDKNKFSYYISKIKYFLSLKIIPNLVDIIINFFLN